MRILQVHKDFQPIKGGGGTARHIHGLARALVAEGHEVRVVAPDADAEGAPYDTEVAKMGDLGKHVAWADVVHVHGARSGYAVAGALLSKKAGKPFFYTPHAFYGAHSRANAAAKAVWDRTAEKFLLEKGDRTLLLTDAWFDFLAARNISAKRTAIIPNCVLGADLAEATGAAPRLPGSPAVLSVGRLDAVKRLDDVIRALAQPGLTQGHLHIVGKGAERDALEALATSLGVADRVTFHGFVTDAGVAAMMRGADGFVLASEQEGLPTVLLEALLSDLPVVCSRIPGNLAITNVAGVDTSFDVGDVPALAARLAALGEARVPADAGAKLRRAYTWEYRAREVLDLYRSALDQRRAS